MKKILTLLLLTCASYTVFANATVTQKDWRWRKDNGNDTTATWHASQDQGITRGLCTAGENIRLRMSFLVEYDINNPTFPAARSSDWRISYSTSPTGPFTLITKMD